MLKWVVEAGESGMKLQAFLKTKVDAGVSARQIKAAIDKGHCLINGKVERFASCFVGTGDQVVFNIPETTSVSPRIALEDPKRVLFEDDYILVYNKPSGIASDDKKCLESIQKATSNKQLILVHRLDRDTSGALIFAKSEEIAEAFFTLFKQRKVKKTYLALVDGVPSRPSGIIENYLGKLSVYHGQTLWGEVSQDKGLHARTAWQVKKSGKEASLVVCYPETGRTHQLRVHMSGMGHPILGDFQYGRSFRCSYRPERTLLHAVEIAFEHPKTRLPIVVYAPLPDDFCDAEAILKLK